jgi:Fuc2NAc and GlcNAc transferase
MSSPCWWTLPLAAASSWLLLAVLLPLLQRAWLDQPNQRSSHTRPTPRGGGVAFVLIAALAWLLGGDWVLLCCLPLALVGFVDDRVGLPVGLRYGVQLLTAAALVLQSRLPGVALGSGWWLLLALVVAATALINFTNFMDGLDGLVAGCLLVVLLVAAISGLPALWPLVGALLGFLPWNWSPARVFMGDVGSTFLGAVLAAALLGSPSWGQALGILLVASPLLADALSCVLRRALAGQPLLQAHRLHLYQRLQQAGWSHRQVSGTYIAATTGLGVLVFSGNRPLSLVGALLVLLIGVSLERRVAVPFAEAMAAGHARR